jgi:hypothetical protein
MTKLGFQPKILLPEGEFFRFEILSADIEDGEYGYQLGLELKTLGGKHAAIPSRTGRRSVVMKMTGSLSKRAQKPKSWSGRSSAMRPTSRTSTRMRSRAGASWLALPFHRTASAIALTSALSAASLIRTLPSST